MVAMTTTSVDPLSGHIHRFLHGTSKNELNDGVHGCLRFLGMGTRTTRAPLVHIIMVGACSLNDGTFLHVHVVFSQGLYFVYCIYTVRPLCRRRSLGGMELRFVLCFVVLHYCCFGESGVCLVSHTLPVTCVKICFLIDNNDM